MADLGGFDANAPENRSTRSVLPAGEYRACLVSSDRKACKSGNEYYLNLDFQILSGDFQNQHIFARLNLWLDKSKSTAIQIAKGQLSELCRAVGVPTPKDSTELHNKPVIVKVKVKNGDQGEQNEVAGFKPATVQAATAPQPAPRESQAAVSVWG